jgi:hypothetical protein
MKKANEDLLEEMIPISKREHFLKRALTFILAMARILGADVYFIGLMRSFP